MGKKLIIAEKGTVAADIARVLGKVPKTKPGCYENDEWVISHAVGHLVEIVIPEQFEAKRGKWTFAHLPALPPYFDLQPIKKTESQLKLLMGLLKRKDVEEVINACDAGREGELIFHYILDYAKCKKPVRRLWLNSMTADSIREGFRQLKPREEFLPLADAAVCRSESDWLVGINATRAMTAFNSKGGGFQLTPVGRVQTPTLAILAEREEKIREFKPRAYFEVFGDFEVAAGGYRGRWFDEAFKKSEDEDARAERLWTRERAEAIAAKCAGKPGIVTEEKKPSTQVAPLLYDLTTLQREANSRFGLSASRTLQIAQALYERHKVLTYPRTDSRYLPADYLPNVRSTMGKLESPDLAEHARKAMAAGYVGNNRRVFNDAKVTDHHAIIPTGVSTKTLDDFELKIFDMVARRFVAAFYPAAQFEITTRITRVENEPFRTDGKILTEPGWLAVYGKQAAGEDGEAAALVPVVPGEPAATKAVEVKESQTRPPARFNEGTLLSAMEGAGKLVDDEELREAMSQRGLGTPATRANIIEGLLREGYLIKQGRELVVTQKGLSLITLLRGIGIPALTSPEMTGDWEFRLKRMERGEMARENFMEEIRRFTTQIVETAKNFSGEVHSEHFVNLEATCPKCGHGVFKESLRAFECAECGVTVWKNMAGRELEREEIKTLIDTRQVGPLEGFRSKLGRPFSALVRIGEDFKQTFDFGEDKRDTTPVDFSAFPVVAKCPCCADGNVHELAEAYSCDQTPSKKCVFRMAKKILQREIPREQVIKLLATGKTDLLPRFISKKGRPFSAYLKLEKGKVGFEFEPREPRKPKSAKSATPAKSAKSSDESQP